LAVRVDADLLERVLSPLLENACRHANSHVTVAIEEQDGTVTLTVEDDGPGILEKDSENVFTPGYRGEDGGGGTRGDEGAGLGLALARRLARGVGGDIRLVGGQPGARFVVSLPRG
jgi:signal transduction histidine kinase